ncbi:MAG TPA: hypothetical protein VKE96_08755 [Vicinamibacterales bacterium]|nr:hypothetical protein [Vicinamibacterales bacterium]
MRPSVRHLAFGPAVLLSAAIWIGGCGHDDGPMAPSSQSAVAVTAVSPPSGSTITPTGTPPGAFLPRGSGLLGATVTVTAGEELPFARLELFLATADGGEYCGQNLPDSPTWRPFHKGQTVTYTVTGFQVFRLPCQVTGIRAVFHTRDNPNLGGIPPAEFRVADSTLPVVYQLRQ